MCGVLPTADEVKTFLDSKDADKRAKLIDQLLERPEYADFWTLKWSDVFRSTRKTIQLKGTHVFQTWLRNHIDNNDGFDQIVHEVITASGSTFANPPANYYRIARDPTSARRDDRPALLRHPHAVRQVPQPSVRALDAGRLLQHGRVLRPREAAQGSRSSPAATPRRRTAPSIIYVDRGGEVTQPRTGKPMAPKFMGGAVAELRARQGSPRGRWPTG